MSAKMMFSETAIVPSHGDVLIEEAMDRLAKAQRPIIYAGGGVVNSGPRASELLREPGSSLERCSCHQHPNGFGQLPRQ